ncbi:3-oxoadipate enol-lactonase [Prauserella shujinwangii]|uniref:3-oxoadipate enol-lactonase n=1 Tax=Prauserella shujinwangii TaxID=1453103 RepID=A0A2T0M0G5_9PSEU|nr:alpha/beta fold hydrolase [Prauserella shujinwangii]PRX50082.1 3-oxoadipate enol-lactonase [Prauserella shujinwangii]
MSTSLGTVKAGQIEIAYAESGSGEPVILLHGGESTHIQWDTFRPLLGAGIRAIAYDQRDSGASVNPPDPYGIPDLAGDCAALIRGLGYERAHIFGSSFGGFIALQVAVSVPDVVQSLTVGATYSNASALHTPAVSEIVELSPSQRDARMLALALSERGQADEKVVAELRSILVHRSPEADARRLAAIPGFDVTDRLPEITAPTLLIYGEDDPAAPPDIGQKIADAIPGARLEVMPGARHGFMVEFAQETARLLRDFVLAHPSQSAR